MTSPTKCAGAGRIAAAALTAALVGSIFAGRAGAVLASPQDSVRSFYNVLLATMRNGRSLGQSGRYAALAPAVNGVFDVPLMARLAVGPAWAGLSPVQQQQIIAAFGRYVSATYADRFDSYSGQQLQVTGAEPYAAGVIVETRIVDPGADPVNINYLMRRNGDAWQIADVYLDGTISQLATQRSEFQSILARQGVDGLIMALNRKVDLLTSDAAKSP
ncbi:MAG TPA: ABC transporter substrate-binding protein [Stellaceae bacterium]|jgi:phospholipid transport system substrate-binding protein